MKPNLTWCPPEALHSVGMVLTKGHEKYPDERWRDLSVDTHLAAALRHVLAHQKGTIVDKESGELSLAHAACRLLFAVGIVANTEEEEDLVRNYMDEFSILKQVSSR